jgi:hypothetical protein
VWRGNNNEFPCLSFGVVTEVRVETDNESGRNPPAYVYAREEPGQSINEALVRQ